MADNPKEVRTPPHAPTAHDVAARAGVSQSAVSRAFTEGASVSPDTRRKVLEAARELGYRPNLIARSLITRRSGVIGVVVGYLENQFYPAVLQALSQTLHRAGYRILLFTPDSGEDNDPMLEEVLRYRVDGLVMASAMLSSRFAEECRQAGLPVVLFNRTTGDADASSVTGDNEKGAAVIADFLAAGGHRRFAFVSGLRDSSTNRDREAGFSRRLAELGLPPALQAEGRYDFAEAQRATRALFSGSDRPDAVFCANDHTALAVMETVRAEFGLQVGREVSIVGFDDAPPAAWPSFALTTYSQPIGPMVDSVAEILREAIAAPGMPTVHRITPGALIVRGSARRPASGIVRAGEGVEVWSPLPAS
jgi:DNA-binding LacI/PurR family transcriptional regulator